MDGWEEPISLGSSGAEVRMTRRGEEEEGRRRKAGGGRRRDGSIRNVQAFAMTWVQWVGLGRGLVGVRGSADKDAVDVRWRGVVCEGWGYSGEVVKELMLIAGLDYCYCYCYCLLVGWLLWVGLLSAKIVRTTASVFS